MGLTAIGYLVLFVPAVTHGLDLWLYIATSAIVVICATVGFLNTLWIADYCAERYGLDRRQSRLHLDIATLQRFERSLQKLQERSR